MKYGLEWKTKSGKEDGGGLMGLRGITMSFQVKKYRYSRSTNNLSNNLIKFPEKYRLVNCKAENFKLHHQSRFSKIGFVLIRFDFTVHRFYSNKFLFIRFNFWIFLKKNLSFFKSSKNRTNRISEKLDWNTRCTHVKFLVNLISLL